MKKEKTHLLPPLAERMRPKKISDFVGQHHLIGKNSILQNLVKNQKLISMIFWGPPGTGKTTLAKILAQEISCDFYTLSAVDASVKDVRKIIAKAEEITLLKNRTTLLFIDEIHRFNKAQQDAFLHAVESGTIVLIGATTENPSFEVIAPLLSRCKVLALRHHTETEIETILQTALEADIILGKSDVAIAEDARTLLIQSAGGDARKLLNTLELVVDISLEKTIAKETVFVALQEKTAIYDKTGDYHYDAISAFIKSIRGSDPDAGIYWLAVMLEGGEKPEFIARRLVILASEDIGNADPLALTISTSGFQAVHQVGMPESSLILAQMVTYLASAPKSNASAEAIWKATETIKAKGAQSVPLHLRNAPTKLMKNLGYGKDYQYVHKEKAGFVEEQYLPTGVSPNFFRPTEHGYEKHIKMRLKKLWGDRD